MASLPLAARDAQGYTALRSYRYERKFVVDELLPAQAEAIIRLHPLMFSVAYPRRFVNNLYFDSPDMENYNDNVSGAGRRQKVRVRWYGTAFGPVSQPVLEIKVKDGLVGTKHSYPLSSFTLDAGFRRGSFKSIALVSSLPENIFHHLCSLEAVLFNRYRRRYYVSWDDQFRVTLDSELAFYSMNAAISNAFIHHQVNEHQLVVELKYEVDQEPRASRVAAFFPFRATRSSKYVQGIERVYF